MPDHPRDSPIYFAYNTETKLLMCLKARAETKLAQVETADVDNDGHEPELVIHASMTRESAAAVLDERRQPFFTQEELDYLYD